METLQLIALALAIAALGLACVSLYYLNKALSLKDEFVKARRPETAHEYNMRTFSRKGLPGMTADEARYHAARSRQREEYLREGFKADEEELAKWAE